MRILSFNSINGEMVGEVEFTGNSFVFADPPDTSDDIEDEEPSPSEGGTPPIFIEKDEAKKMLGIENDSDLRAYLKLTRELNIDMNCRKTFGNMINPLTETYDRWMKAWRIETIDNAYDFREGLENFVGLKRDREVNVYLRKIENLVFMLHDGSRDLELGL